MKKNKYILIAAFFFAVILIGNSEPDLNPGKDRWIIKTSVLENKKAKKVSLDKLLALGNPIDKSNKKLDTSRIKNSVDGLKEGDMITTKGWFKLVAFENGSTGDGDYHIQLRTDSSWKDTCFIVEIPFEDFIKNNPALKDSCKKARAFVCDKVLKTPGTEPKEEGNVIDKAYVSVTGALFFDAHHINANPPRGKSAKKKKKMHSYTCWEIHPVTHIEFAKRP